MKEEITRFQSEIEEQTKKLEAFYADAR